MTRDEIILELYKAQTVERTARKLFPRIGSEEFYQDICQEIYLMVCAMCDDKLQRLHSEGNLTGYVAKMTINQIVNDKSMINTKYYKLETHRTKVSLNEDRLQQPEAEGGTCGG